MTNMHHTSIWLNKTVKMKWILYVVVILVTILLVFEYLHLFFCVRLLRIRSTYARNYVLFAVLKPYLMSMICFPFLSAAWVQHSNNICCCFIIFPLVTFTCAYLVWPVTMHTSATCERIIHLLCSVSWMNECFCAVCMFAHSDCVKNINCNKLTHVLRRYMCTHT